MARKGLLRQKKDESKGMPKKRKGLLRQNIKSAITNNCSGECNAIHSETTKERNGLLRQKKEKPVLQEPQIQEVKKSKREIMMERRFSEQSQSIPKQRKGLLRQTPEEKSSQEPVARAMNEDFVPLASAPIFRQTNSETEIATASDIASVNGKISYVSANAVTTTGNQDIQGNKTFYSKITLKTNAQSSHPESFNDLDNQSFVIGTDNQFSVYTSGGIDYYAPNMANPYELKYPEESGTFALKETISGKYIPYTATSGILVGNPDYSEATGLYAIGLGSAVHATGETSFAAGPNASAIGKASVAIGRSAYADGLNSVAIRGEAFAQNSVAIGLGEAHGRFSTVVGGRSGIASGINSTVIGGYYNQANADFSTALGYKSYIPKESEYSLVWNGTEALGLSDKYIAHGPGTFNINPSAGISGVYIGEENLPTILSNTTKNYIPYTPTSGIMVGDPNYAEATGDYAVALGSAVHANGDRSVAIGGAASALALNAVAIGGTARASAINSLAIVGGKAYGANTVAIGTQSQTSGNFSMAVGRGAKANDNYAVAIGPNTSDAEYSITMGYKTHSYPASKYSFTWNGNPSLGIQNEYAANGGGTFNINPSAGISGFYIGTKNLYTILSEQGDGDTGDFLPLSGGEVSGDVNEKIDWPYIYSTNILLEDEMDGTSNKVMVNVSLDTTSSDLILAYKTKEYPSPIAINTEIVAVTGNPSQFPFDISVLSGEKQLTWTTGAECYRYVTGDNTLEVWLGNNGLFDFYFSTTDEEHYYGTEGITPTESTKKVSSRFITEMEVDSKLKANASFDLWRKGNTIYAGTGSDHLSAGTNNSVFIGSNQTITDGKGNSVVIGSNTQSKTGSVVVIGNNAKVTDANSVGHVVIGANSQGYGYGASVAVGNFARAYYLGVAIGPEANAEHENAVAVGWRTNPRTNKDIAIGREAQTSGGDGNQSNIAIGAWSKAFTTGNNTAITIGGGTVSGNMSISLGGSVYANDAIQLGYGTNTTPNTLQYRDHKIADTAGKLYYNNTDIASMFATKNDLSDVVKTSGNQSISGEKVFANQIQVASDVNPGFNDYFGRGCVSMNSTNGSHTTFLYGAASYNFWDGSAPALDIVDVNGQNSWVYIFPTENTYPSGGTFKLAVQEDANLIKVDNEFVDTSTATTSFVMKPEYGKYRGVVGSNGILPTFDWTNYNLSPINTNTVYHFHVSLYVNAGASTLTDPNGVNWVTGAGLPNSGFAGHWIFMSFMKENFTNTIHGSVWRVG